jgi:polysaccharide biosynthesis transport protein
MHSPKPTISGVDRVRAVWHRRKWPALVVFLTLLTACVTVARGLPNLYAATTMLLVERPQVSDPRGGAPTELDVETRLRTLNQEIQSRSRLEELITQFNLYPELRGRATPEAIADRMRRDIQLQFRGVQTMIGLDATFAFTLTYWARDPETAARVVNALAAQYVDENTRAREQQTVGTTEFLQGQLQEAERKLREQEQRMSRFTEQYNGELPEQQSANLAALGRLNEQLVVLMDRRNELTRQLATLADSPNMTGSTPSARLARLRQQLADLRTRDTEEHPDVVRVKQEIAALEHQLSADSGTGSAAATDPRAAIEAELAGLRNTEQTVRREIATYEQRVENAPLRDQALQQLTQDYTAAKALYESLLQRYQDALLTAGMAQQRLQGEQIRILDPAVTPRTPSAPRRFQLMFMGLLLSVGAAFGVVAVAETVDTSFHVLDDLRAFTRIPVLVSIPPITTHADALLRRRRLGVAALATALGIVAVVAVSYHLAYGNESLIHLLEARSL